MTIEKIKIATLLAVLALQAVAPRAQVRAESPVAREVRGMLRQFLDDAAQGNRAGFERFFADDVIYTRSTGVVMGKPELLKNVENLKPTDQSKTTYAAEDATVHEYGDTAVVAFRLAARTEHKDGKTETNYFRNTGTFLRRNGRWQVIAWQATKIPESNTGK
ncbi:MAG TPA: nuclear transport factor 2 family protein [Candidatus Acidoferrales bacterium]|nr:nuclear transport factor 2 family protein [Candidatus Acidoferrales bacterium]